MYMYGTKCSMNYLGRGKMRVTVCKSIVLQYTSQVSVLSLIKVALKLLFFANELKPVKFLLSVHCRTLRKNCI